MNIDEFLDKVDVKDKDSDTIVIDSPDESEDDLDLVEESDEVKGSNLVNEKNVDKIDKKEVEKPVEVKEKKEVQLMPETQVVKKKETKKHSIFDLVELINHAIKQENLVLAQKYNLQFEKEYSMIPKSDDILKLELNKLMLQLNSHLSNLKKKVEQKYLLKEKEIIGLLNRGQEYWLKKDFLNSKKIFANILKEFKVLPGGFSQSKGLLKDKILQFQLNLRHLQQELVDKKLQVLRQEMLNLIRESQVYFKENKIVDAKQKLLLAQKMLNGVDDEFKSKFLDVHDLLVKRLSMLEMVSQIKSLRKELGADFNSVFKDEVELEKKSFEFREKESKVLKDKSLLKDKTALKPKVHFDFLKNKPDVKPVDDLVEKLEVKNSEVQNSELKNSEVEFESKEELNQISEKVLRKHSVVDDSIKKIMIGKVRLALVDENFKLARDLLVELKREYFDDSEVMGLINKLESNEDYMDSIAGLEEVKEGEAIEKELDKVEEDVFHGDSKEIRKDFDEIKKEDHNLVFEDVVEEVEEDEKELDESDSFMSLKKKLSKTKGELDAKLIDRKLTLAKHQIKKGDFGKAKQCLDFIFEKDPKNRKAKKLVNMMS